MHIEARKLVKVYKKRVVVNQVSLRVEKGEIVGLLGPNGAVSGWKIRTPEKFLFPT